MESNPNTENANTQNANKVQKLDIIPTLVQEINKNIVDRLSVVDKVTSASLVCSEWWNFCKEPDMWKIVDMRNNNTYSNRELVEICTYALNRGLRNVEEIYIDNFATDHLLRCISNNT